jgi:YidC/Oxa1 family membrane protein insertase
MDTKRLIIGMLLITALGLGYQYFLAYEYKQHPEWAKPGNQTSSTQTGSTASTAQPAFEPVDTGGVGHEALDWKVLPPAQPSAPVLLGYTRYDDPNYHMAVSIVPTGAAVDSVVLNQFHEEADNPELYIFQKPYDFDPVRTRALATTRLIVGADKEGNPLYVPLGATDWTLVSANDHHAEYQIDLTQFGKPALRILKKYTLTPAQSDPQTPQGYELDLSYSLQNLSKNKQSVAIDFNGPTVPRAESIRQDVEVVGGYADDGLFNLDHLGVSSKIARPPNELHDFLDGPDKRQQFLWMGESSNYFNAIVRAPNQNSMASADAVVLNPDTSSSDRLTQLRFGTAAIALAPGATASVPFQVFFGPKTRALLNSPYYSSLPRNYDQTLIMIGGCFLYALCTSATLINLLVGLLAGIHFVLHDWGLAIIVMVIAVRICLHPLLKKSQVSMMRMQKLAPEMERLKKKFGDDKDGFAKAQMELYKTEGFAPILGCAPMFLQMPIFIALWRALQTTFELRQAPFLYFFGIHFTWIHDLSQPDFLVKFASPVPLFIFGWHLAGINVLPLLMAGVTFINQKYFAPKPAAVTPEQEQQQKMMVYMTLMFPIMFYSLPSGLNLYYLTSTSLGILESQRIRAHIKKMDEEAAKQGPVKVDAGKLPRGSARRRDKPEPPAKKGFWAKMQERAEQIAREQQRQRKKR